MAKLIPRKPDAHVSNGDSISFTKDDETGLFRKVTQTAAFNHLEHTVKKVKKEVSKKLYKVGDENNWDYKFEVTLPNGNPTTVYFVEA